MTVSDTIVSDMPLGFSFAPAGAPVDRLAAAREFEALLVAQLLKTARQAGEALGSPSTQAGAEGYLELAEEHVARAIAQRGAFGISRLVLRSLEGVDSSGADSSSNAAGQPEGQGGVARTNHVFSQTADKNYEGREIKRPGGNYGNIPTGR